MILNNAPQNEAVLSNVGEIGEFRIRNSAKAFNILSSGLYANKIKAIIRELSCNAVDAHIAAGNGGKPFEVHIPNSLEPHFSIRDFGIGLNHDQVTNIYTTYFESTKTNSNAFIGALGLGSKSPFSYTDNFTVTAIKDGRKGIYSAFINGEGVPSIALMMEEATDEANGVEIKFSVNDRYDFQKFKEEAATVYRYFKLQPVVTGGSISIAPIKYETRDLIPGVHVVEQQYSRGSRSVAVMGNIAYPIEVPNADQLGPLAKILSCGLEMHFGIGELDFQASREGLSYIPQTIDAIKKKLELVNAALATHLEKEMNAIPNEWDRAIALNKKREHELWYAAVTKYALDTKLKTVDPSSGRYSFLKTFKLKVEDIESKFNISVRGFYRSRGSSTCSTLTAETNHIRNFNGQGGYATENQWAFHVNESTEFVTNDTNVGVGERAKYHYRNQNTATVHVYVLDKANPDKEMQLDAFFKEIANPPATRIHKASSLTQKPRRDSSVGRNVSILGMENRRRGYSNDTVVWVDAGKLDSFDANKTHYYVPLSGYVVQGKTSDAKQLREWLESSGLAQFANIKIQGVRKTDLDAVKKLKNWVNVEDHIEKTIGVPDQNLILTMALSEMKPFDFMGGRYSDAYAFKHDEVKESSPFKAFIKKYDNFKRVQFSDYALKTLYSVYGTKINFDTTAAVKAVVAEQAAIRSRYPLLGSLGVGVTAEAVAEYVNLIDISKGI